MLRVRKELLRLSVEEDLDVVHFAFDYPSVPVDYSGVKAAIVVTVHHLHLAELISDIHFTRRWTKALFPGIRQALMSLSEELLIRQGGLVISVSEFTKRTLCTYLHVQPERIRVIYNGVDLSEMSEKSPEPPALLSQGGGFVLFVGRLEPSKGLEYLIRAFSQSKKEIVNATLMVVGQGPQMYVASLRALTASLGLSSSVIFTGRLSAADLKHAYSSCSMVVLPSIMEGLGMSLIEGMAAGKPCLGTTAGAIPEVITGGSTGLLVAPGDVRALSEAIVFLSKNKEDAKAMGDSGRESVSKRFTLAEMAKRTEAVYNEALNTRLVGPRTLSVQS